MYAACGIVMKGKLPNYATITQEEINSNSKNIKTESVLLYILKHCTSLLEFLKDLYHF